MRNNTPRHHDRTLVATAKRELEEESHLAAAAADFEEVARIKFFDGETPMFDCTVFLVRRWCGTERPTAEMRPAWFSVEDIPYDDMWAGDRHWLPLVLAGKKFSGILRYKPGATEVESFVYIERPT